MDSEHPHSIDHLIDPIRYVRHRLSLQGGTDIPGTIERVSEGAMLTPENLWLLACSAILASIGLDVSSAAVIIGAMLISPLMGPILGVGLGFGTADRALLQRALRELAFATLFTIAVSATYFVISPLATPTAELVSRTRPTLLDVGVAFFGGVAGVVAGSRKQVSLALPGVAIATALMPPLCTAGFGLATGNWAFFFGAFYLYALNAIFIGLSTFLIVRMLHFPPHVQLTPEARRRERRVVAAVAFLAILPSIYFLYDTVTRVREDRRIADFVRHEIQAPGRSASQWEHQHDSRGDVLKIYVAGHPIEAAQADSIRAKLPDYGLKKITLDIVQSDISAADLERFQGGVQRDILRAVSTALAARDSAAPLSSRDDPAKLAQAARELVSAFPEIARATYAPRQDLLAQGAAAEPAPTVLVTFSSETPATVRRDILGRSQALLRARLGMDSLRVLER